MTSFGNAVLRSLPADEIERLSPYLQRARLQPGQVLFGTEEPLTQLWFPESGAVTRLVHLNNGESVEVGTVGSDGVAGLPIALGGNHGIGQCTVQIGGWASVLNAADFEEHVRKLGSPLLSTLLTYASVSIAVLCQLTACHCLHRIEQRLVRCLLTLDDHGGDGNLRITHDTLAAFLGVHRPSITYALQALAATGALAMQRRRIALLDRDALAAVACECYTNIKRITSSFTQLQP